MKVRIEHRYLVFPTNRLAVSKKLTMTHGADTVYQLDINLDNSDPDFYAYVDVSRFMGLALDISVSPDMVLDFSTADEIDKKSAYGQKYRPQIHFTTKNGWINDPNGLIYLDGVYHMFYQYNPCAIDWGNMHWGHATSRDLIHWQEEPIALYPDKSGHMFSGSAILDKGNKTCLGTQDKPAALLYYTATAPFSQWLAYSTDGFKTVTKLDKALIPNVVGSNRDPKVVYCEEWGAYLLALYLERDVYAIFRSDDMLSWREVQRISLLEDNECPDIFCLTDGEGIKRWVLMGAHGRYAVGDMTENGFVQIGETKSLHYGKSAYAGQSFSGIEGGRVIRVDWDRSNIRKDSFACQMGIPCEMQLLRSGNEYYVTANPVKETEALIKKSDIYRDVKLDKGVPVQYKTESCPYLIKIRAEKTAIDANITLMLFGRRLELKISKNELVLGRHVCPLSVSHKGLDITVITDRLSIEIYLDGGRICTTFMEDNTAPDYINVPYVELCANECTTVDLIELHALASIWESEE